MVGFIHHLKAKLRAINTLFVQSAPDALAVSDLTEVAPVSRTTRCVRT